MASYPTTDTEFIPAKPAQLDGTALQAAIERAEKFNYLTARLSIRELMQQDAAGWTSQGTIDAWTKRLNDLPEAVFFSDDLFLQSPRRPIIALKTTTTKTKDNEPCHR